jgi:hypothetical protein
VTDVEPEFPGVYTGLPEAQYHAHPALSASGAKLLLPPSCPALFKYDRDNPQEGKRSFDYGSAAHKALLGSGPQVEWYDAPDWKTKKAQEWAKACRAEGVIPAMVAALHAHPFAAALFDPERGDPEVSAFWHDPTWGVDRRCRYDWLPHTDGGRMIIPDFKTARAVDLRSINQAIAQYRYAMQATWYMDMAHGLQLAEDIAFVFVFQLKDPPYLITTVQLDASWEKVGRLRNDAALERFADCTATGLWPGFTDDVELVTPPAWALYEAEEL